NLNAGIIETFTITIYSRPVVAPIRNAPVPITGGILCPAAEDTVSIAPASWGLYPVFFIIGIVNVPVVTTFDIVLPEILPIAALLRTATFAGPPALSPA